MLVSLYQTGTPCFSRTLVNFDANIRFLLECDRKTSRGSDVAFFFAIDASDGSAFETLDNVIQDIVSIRNEAYNFECLKNPRDTI